MNQVINQSVWYKMYIHVKTVYYTVPLEAAAVLQHHSESAWESETGPTPSAQPTQYWNYSAQWRSQHQQPGQPHRAWGTRLTVTHKHTHHTSWWATSIQFNGFSSRTVVCRLCWAPLCQTAAATGKTLQIGPKGSWGSGDCPQVSTPTPWTHQILTSLVYTGFNMQADSNLYIQQVILYWWQP